MDPAGYPHPSFTWTSQHSIMLHGVIPAGDALSVQVSWDPGWRASIGGRDVKITSDALGLMTVHARCDSPCAIELRYADPWRTATRIASALGLLGLLAWVFAPRLRSRGPSALPVRAD
jgi:hypothetical protein